MFNVPAVLLSAVYLMDGNNITSEVTFLSSDLNR